MFHKLQILLQDPEAP